MDGMGRFSLGSGFPFSDLRGSGTGPIKHNRPNEMTGGRNNG